MAITVRRVEADDLDQLRLHQSRPELGLVDKHFSAMNEGRLIFAVALDGAAALGTALLDFESGDLTPELRNMYVYPSARRLGAGRALSEFIEDEAKAAGYTAVYLAVDPNNEKAVPLYERVIEKCRERGFTVGTGEFGATMQVTSENDGPVTIILDTNEL